MKKYALLRAILYLLLGLAMLIFPETVITAIVYIIGGYAVIMGVMSIFSGRGKDGQGGSGGLVGGILLIALGVCMFIFSRFIASILPLVLGILMLIVGITQIVAAIGMRSLTGKINVFQLVLGILVLVGGVLGIINPFGTLALLVRVLGGVLIITAVNEFSLYLSLRKTA